MSKDREELIEVMARAAFYADLKLCEDAFGANSETWEDGRRQPAYRTIAQAALSAIEGAGKVVLSRTLTTAQLQAAQDFEVSLSWEQAQDLFDAMINAYSPKPSGVEDE